MNYIIVSVQPFWKVIRKWCLLIYVRHHTHKIIDGQNIILAREGIKVISK